MKTRTFLLILIFFCVTPSARADFMLDLSGTYLTEGLNSTDVKEDSTKYSYDVVGYIQFAKSWWAGWNYMGVNMTGTSNATGTTVPTSFASIDTGPSIKYYFGKSEMFSLSAAYNILAKASYKNVVTDKTESWQGTSYLVSLGVMPEIKSGFHIGVSVNYYHAAYTKRTVDGTETSDGNTKNWTFPSISISKMW